MTSSKKWALVTGASVGIGNELCKDLARRGWNVVLVARDEKKLIELKQVLESAFGVQAQVLRADLKDPNDREKVIEAIKLYHVSFFVNNAGVQCWGFEDKPFAEAQSLVELNINALVHLSHAAVSHFQKQIGQRSYLLNVGSVNSFIPTSTTPVYAASKAFVKSFSLALVDRLKGTQVSCTCLCPGGTESEIMTRVGTSIAPTSARFMMKASVVAKLGIDGTLKGKPVVIPGYGNRFLIFLSYILPEMWVIRFTSMVLKRSIVAN